MTGHGGGAARDSASRPRAGAAMATAIFVLYAAATAGLFGLLQGLGWWLLMLLVGAIIIGLGAALRATRIPRWIIPIAQLAGAAGILTLGFGRGSGLAGVVPTGATISTWASTFARALRSINEQATPAPELPELLFLVTGGGCLVAIILDTIACTLRVPAISVVAVIGVLVVPAALLGDGVQPVALAATAAAFLGVLWVGQRGAPGATPHPSRSSRGSAALAVGGTAVVVALVVGATAPGFAAGGTSSFTPGGVSFGTGVAPLVELGNDLRRPGAVQTMSYSTTASVPAYLTLTTLDEFSGATWTHRRGITKRLPGTDTVGPVPGLSSAVARSKVTTDIHILNMKSQWLPAPAPVEGVHGLTGIWSFDPTDLSVLGVDTTSTTGQNYRVVSLTVAPTAAQLASAGGAVPADVRRDLALPSRMPAIIAQTARSAAAGATSEYQIAVNLQNYFHDSGFTYSTETPLRERYDGDGAAVIAKFLQVKSGYCVHFASAMAVMARTLGIPSRVAVGYLPGSSSGVTSASGASEYTVTSDDLHAWPELYFAGVGWVPFEPTVGRGTVPSYTQQSTSSESTGADTSSATASGTPLAESRPRTTSAPVVASSDAGGGSSAGGLAAPVLGAILVLLAPAIVRWFRRRVRIARADRGDAGLAGAWSEIVDTAVDVGAPVSAAQTPRVIAARVGSRLNTSEAEALLRLLAAVEHSRFAPPGSRSAMVSPADVSLVVHAVTAHASWSARVAAVFAPRSLASWISRRFERGAVARA